MFIFVALLAALLLTLLCAFLIFTLFNQTKTQRIAKDRILSYMIDKGYKMVSFEAIQRYIRQDYDDEFLNRLPDYFPRQFRLALLRDEYGRLTRPGLARVRESPQEEGSPAGPQPLPL
jgi:hypothetical protein